MAHQEQIEFVQLVKNRFPEYFRATLVLDVGSLHINGCNRHFFEDAGYTGVDIDVGRNVDLVTPAHKLMLPDSSFDTIISTECFEHDPYYSETIKNIFRMLKPGGLFIFTCATTGRPEHGTTSTTPEDAPLGKNKSEFMNYYKNLTVEDIIQVIDVVSLFKSFEFSVNEVTHDLYFWGVKNGTFEKRTDYSFLSEDAEYFQYKKLVKNMNSICSQLENDLNAQLSKLNNDFSERECGLNIEISKLHNLIDQRNGELHAHKELITKIINSKDILKNKINNLNHELKSNTQAFNKLIIEFEKLKELNKAEISKTIAQTERADQIEQRLYSVISTKSWIFLQFFRSFLKKLNQFLINIMKLRVRHFSIVYQLLKRNDFRGLKYRFLNFITGYTKNNSSQESKKEIKYWGIITPQHTISLAEIIKQNILRHGFNVEIIIGEPLHFHLDMYIILCANVIKNLPPGEKRIIYQLEQLNNKRWFTEDYINKLNSSFHVLEYSEINLKELAIAGIKFPHVSHLPVSSISKIDNKNEYSMKKFDILFYGDSLSSPRRRKMLDALRTKFSLLELNDCFGDELYNHIRSSKLVINLHYYENALLETPRIVECLSLGTTVVSEDSRDMGLYPEFNGAVSFFPTGNIELMIKAVSEALNTALAQTDIMSFLTYSNDKFSFMFDRFLIGAAMLSADYVNTMKKWLPQKSHMYALSLVETVERRDYFNRVRPKDCVIFDGMRRNPGWIGCGLSYLYLWNYAIENHLEYIIIMEDDVVLPDNFDFLVSQLISYLNGRKDSWHIFSGVMASIHDDTRVIQLDSCDGIDFVTIDKMTSTVFNIYNRTILDKLCQWNPHDLNSKNNTIDRFIENIPDLRVVTTMPFLFDHHEDVNSTLWGFQNDEYTDWIDRSQKKLKKLTSQFVEKSIS